MTWRSIKKDIDKIYLKIDKISKVGRDNFQEYYNYVDNLISNSQYGLYTQVLFIKYDFDYSKFRTVDSIKKQSWSQILLRTRTSLQDGIGRISKERSTYRIGFDVYLEKPTPYAVIIDPTNNGRGADIKLIISDDTNRGLSRVSVIRSGSNYSTQSYCEIYGGLSASVSPYIRGGSVLKVDIIGSGSSFGVDLKLGSVLEIDRWIESIEPLSYTDDLFQQGTGNKVTHLIVDKVGSTMSATFSNWDFNLTYDRNLLSLYESAYDYLI